MFDFFPQAVKATLVRAGIGWFVVLVITIVLACAYEMWAAGAYKISKED